MRLVATILIALLVAPVALAEGKGKGKGKGPSHAKGGSTVEEVVDTTADDVKDAVLGQQGSPGSGEGPSGLAKKDKRPPGLEKKDKTPEGWSKGEKKSWDEGAEADAERGVFGRMWDRISGRDRASGKEGKPGRTPEDQDD